LGREAVPDVLPEGADFEIGKARLLHPGISREDLFARVDEGPRFDVAFVACGIMVKACVDAAETLSREGVRCAVADFASVKPLDEELLEALALRSKVVVTAEEHSIIGGLGGAVCEVVSERAPRPVFRVGVRDRFGESGAPEELLEAYGLTASSVARCARQALMAAR